LQQNPFGGGAAMCLDRGSNNLLKVIREVLSDKGKIPIGIRGYILIMTVVALILDSFLVTVFVIFIIIVRMMMK
jgi:hypothetical protein